MKKLRLATMSFLPRPCSARPLEEGVAAVGRVGVGVAKLVALGAAAAADGVVATAGVLDDGEQLSTHVGVDAVALGEEDGAGVLHGVGGVVALGGVVGVVGEEVDGLLALKVNEAHTAALWDHAGPMLRWLHRHVFNYTAWDLSCLLDRLGHGWPPWLFWRGHPRGVPLRCFGLGTHMDAPTWFWAGHPRWMPLHGVSDENGLMLADADACLLAVEAACGEVVALAAQDVLADAHAGGAGQVVAHLEVAGHLEVGEAGGAPVDDLFGVDGGIGACGDVGLHVVLA